MPIELLPFLRSHKWLAVMHFKELGADTETVNGYREKKRWLSKA